MFAHLVMIGDTHVIIELKPSSPERDLPRKLELAYIYSG